MAKKHKTKLQQEYQRQVNRVKRRIRELEKRGYEFTDTVLPQTPKTITKKEVQKIADITPDVLYKQARAVDYETGEIISGIERRTYERQQRALKSATTRKRKIQQDDDFWGNTQQNDNTHSSQDYYDRTGSRTTNFTETVIKEYRRQIRKFPLTVASIVLTALDEAIQSSGKDNVALALQSKAESLSDYLNRSHIFGDSISAIQAYCQAMFGDLPGMDSHFMDVINALEDEESMEEFE